MWFPVFCSSFHSTGKEQNAMLPNRLQKLAKVILICMFCLSLTGCWNRREIETLSFLLAAGIDKVGDSYLVSTQVANTEAMEKNASAQAPNFFAFTSKGKTVFDAIRNATHESPSKLFWSHSKVLVLGKNLARQGVIPILDFFSRDADERRLVLIAISEGTAKEIITANVKTKKLPAFGLRDVLEGNYKSTSKTVMTTLNDIIRTVYSTACPLIPVVKIVKSEDGKPAYYVSGAAVLKKGKLVSYLTPNETRGVNWVSGKLKSGIVVAPCFNTQGKKTKNRISYEMFESSAKVKAKRTNGNFTMDVKVKTSGNIAEAEAGCIQNEIDPTNLSKLEDSIAKQIEKEVQRSLTKARHLNTDVFGFGEEIHRHFPDEWKKTKNVWNEKFPTLPVDIHVECKLRGNQLKQYSGVKK
jgi:spore germination protein KC